MVHSLIIIKKTLFCYFFLPFGYPDKKRLYLCYQEKIIKDIVIMAAKKEIRSDNTYIISTDNTDNPKLGAKILSNGRESLFLDYYFGYTMVYDEAKDKQVAKKDRKGII
jgi:hypothetical protein